MRSRVRSSSSFVMWPMIPTCAPVAVAVLVFVRMRRLPPSKACRTTGESVELSREQAVRQVSANWDACAEPSI